MYILIEDLSEIFQDIQNKHLENQPKITKQVFKNSIKGKIIYFLPFIVQIYFTFFYNN